MKFSKTLLHSGFWSLSSSGAQAALQVVVVAILGRILSPHAFGVVAAASIVVEFTNGLALLGVGQALIQRTSLTDLDVRVAFTWAVLSTGVFTTLAFVFSAPLARLLGVPEASDVLKFMSFCFVIKGIGSVAESLAMREFKFKLLAARRITAYFLGYAVVGVIGAVLGLKAYSLVAAQLVQATVATILLVSAQRHSMWPALNGKNFWALARFGTGISLGKIASTCATQADNLVVAHLFGAAPLGLYARAYNLMRFPAMLLGNTIDDVAFPGLSAVQAERKRLAELFRKMMTVFNLLLFPASVAIVILAPELVALLLGPKWTSAVPILQAFCLAMPFRSTYKLSAAVVNATGASWWVAGVSIIYLALVCLCAIVGAFWGLVGVAIGVSLAIFVQFLLLTMSAVRRSGAGATALLAAHLKVFPITALTAAISILVVTGLRQLAAPAFVTLLLSMMVILVIEGFLVLRFPKTLIGEEGLWFLDIVSEKLLKGNTGAGLFKQMRARLKPT